MKILAQLEKVHVIQNKKYMFFSYNIIKSDKHFSFTVLVFTNFIKTSVFFLRLCDLTRPESVWELRALEGGYSAPLLSRLPEMLETRNLGGG